MLNKKGDTQHNQARRLLIRKIFLWSTALSSVLLLYPLKKFLSFKVKPKPKYIKVEAPLPRGLYHAGQGFILFDNGPTSLAVSRTCTHLGCTIQYLEDKEYVECPCHQSRFDREGKRLTGPAERDLTVYSVEVKRDESGAPLEYIVELT